ncbi:MAG TPA: Nif3-like dinuclear metal center hexameric protein, partial [Candidatus Paceibacterota bacterium]|nr:Nif3-like dinuclear metal center hexameric protein [Candidatus Paceibacterota bacterium]
LGNYSFCSFSIRGTGRFKPEAGANPSVGEVGKMESVEEERIEVVMDAVVLEDVIAAMKEVHPYEEVAYEVYALENF